MSSIKIPLTPRVRELDLVDKVAVVTGASRGIGRAIAFNLASRGCSILGTATSDTGVAAIAKGLNDEVTSRAFEGTSRQRPARLLITAVVADIFSTECASIITEEVTKSFNGRVDIFINNAGAIGTDTIGEMDVNHVQQSLLANVQTPVMIVEEFTRRHFFQPNSRIVYISSIRSHFPWSEHLVYSAGKSAGESLCRTWAQAFGGKDERYSFMAGTTANSLSVGLTETDSMMNCPPDILKQLQNEFYPSQSMPRFGQPDDIADIVGLLCSSDARWITGCVVSASGGGIKIGSG
ncbi:hypothetical protein N7448_004802 [Penicillium atrosanguineum]|uniref:NAD(P)-binding protein n=1 Tax=Penicillium atrosanguineum TaxID=1132637 RepID=A0A9W9L4E9_9EURO|nr:uncharacterized protein N7443_008552 [Penicillium atrosanguineum]KAJ5125482.1 hypothetical protein N7526_007659 [Penicillium atrosanguineum]KAJ5136248.1 hypothetical protein N7448_004802 [Penicillium atrosanguineum]KAJ5292599.1 hypothetical protein N7443_008552 [Penicillium atrosanguineum]KAJ5303377.1 hypothetical protein N7476_010176 [Penicillium atrosanguineum]